MLWLLLTQSKEWYITLHILQWYNISSLASVCTESVNYDGDSNYSQLWSTCIHTCTCMTNTMWLTDVTVMSISVQWFYRGCSNSIDVFSVLTCIDCHHNFKYILRNMHSCLLLLRRTKMLAVDRKGNGKKDSSWDTQIYTTEEHSIRARLKVSMDIPSISY